MITNTELLYLKMKQFQDKRVELVEKYEEGLQSIERFKGSPGYNDEEKKLKDQYEADLIALVGEYRPGFLTIFGGMMDAIGRRSISAPTNDQINLLNVLKMKRKVTLEELQRTAEAVKDNPIAISVLNEIAQDHGVMRSFDSLCPEMSSQRASEIVTGMKNGLDDYLQHDTTKASRVADQYYHKHYGTSEGKLTKRRLFTDKADFYREIGLEGETLRQFSEIVDGETV